ncbi:MAG TPA: hypothetical protein VF523_02410, partial [Burkholderiales bacterium]
RAGFLQEAKPLTRQIAAPLLSLMVRQQMAKLSGISQSELDRNFEIKHINRTPVPQRIDAIKPNLVKRLSSMLVYRPALASLTGTNPVVPDWLDTNTSSIDLALLSRLLELCRANPNIRSVMEHFRGDDLEFLAKEAETSSLENMLKDEELDVEFRSTWVKFLSFAEKAEYEALSEKSIQTTLTQAEKVRFSELVMRVRLHTAAPESRTPV